jgi:hypothetical protein
MRPPSALNARVVHRVVVAEAEQLGLWATTKAPVRTPASEGKLEVFISYPRRDALDFADELLAGLELASFAP